jgi:hypothetical protein
MEVWELGNNGEDDPKGYPFPNLYQAARPVGRPVDRIWRRLIRPRARLAPGRPDHPVRSPVQPGQGPASPVPSSCASFCPYALCKCV